ncbi:MULTISPECIES: acyltransferase [unclassified Mesorhizobium]|uniref:acyltransferase n=1 Tax=unclassified Mesorhizobium TaxID=325217 RepID=UPI000FD44BE5|nr:MULTISPECIES: acyltransferase [unclassified Mesorhizobium]RVB77614.1 acyltransferase [Mesorhizobium sp. M6A.T.Cr.TU.014.01.1.1]RWP72032.1 MAG: acyltransferase [Mesorhizobium sp.]RWP97639.1 MAG: acyltransferase [Mesorhizobium sp.]RWP98214.1 MAG: acyltransferase [Mesorhizobium sp.]
MPFVPRFVYRLAGINAGAGAKMSIQSIRTARRGHHAIGEECILHCAFSFDRPDAKITVGQRSYIGKSHLVAAERIEIGNDVIISWGTTVVDHNSHATRWQNRKADVADWHQGKKDWSNITIAPVRIEDNVFIGFNTVILKGVTIGKGAVVGAGSVVTKDVAPFTMVGGNPARQIGDPVARSVA